MVKEKTFVFFCLCFCHLVGVFAGTDELKSVSVTEGDSVSLNSSLTEIQEDEEITWTFGSNKTFIAETDGVKYTIPDDLDERFRDRLKLDEKTGSLTIMNIRTEHAGVYVVDISRSGPSSTYRFNVTVYAATTTDPTTASHPSRSTSDSTSHDPAGLGSLGTALISAAAAAAAGFLLLVVAIVIFFICKRHRKKDQQVEPREEEVTYADTTFHKRNAPKPTAKQEEDVVYAGVVTRR